MKRSLIKNIALLIMLLSVGKGNLLVAQHIIINEIQTSNATTIADEDGDYGDWIEIYNPTNQEVNLYGYCLSDRFTNEDKWVFPDIIIQPNEFKIIFASGKDRKSGVYLHTNFNLSKDGNPVILTNYYGDIIDVFNEIPLLTDVSYGRKTDGGNDTVMFFKPTPGFSNSLGTVYHEVKFSKRGGIYNKSFNLSLSTDSDNDIYYTIDGSTPNVNSLHYAQSLNLNNDLCSNTDIYKLPITLLDSMYFPEGDVLKAIVIRAAVFDDDGKILGNVVTQSYFISDLGVNHYDLPIISISADYNDLFNDTIGIFVQGVYFDPLNPNWSGNYYMSGQDWERPVNIEFYEPNNVLGFNQIVGLRTHGGNARRLQQKGMKIYARSEYGNSTFAYKMFKDKNIYEYKRFVIKPFVSSWSYAGIEDFLSNKLAKDLIVDHLAIRPAIVYLNGEYWGIYFLQEKIDKFYVQNNFRINEDSVDMIFNYFGAIQEGYADSFFQMYEFFKNNDISDFNNYSIAKQLIDIDNFIDYQILEIYIANLDWPSNNTMMWKERASNSKWRWIFFDGDAGFGDKEVDFFPQAMSLDDSFWPSNAQSTLIFRKLMENIDFRTRFFKRFEDLLNSVLYISNMQGYYNEFVNSIDTEIAEQSFRFNFPINTKEWRKALASISDFLIYRACELSNIIASDFNFVINITPCGQVPPTSDISFIISPNPADDKFTIYLDSVATIYSISLVDVTGTIVKHFNLNYPLQTSEIELNCSDLENGMYFLKVDNRINSEIKKLLISR